MISSCRHGFHPDSCMVCNPPRCAYCFEPVGGIYCSDECRSMATRVDTARGEE